ncbi:MAG TPA: D-glycero-beta-D-manno-heptose-7-phosphate kinase [Prolixibacteraceae bacterium]|nr:D-glycero-beta-D-manno-heptose-7-phosphate kinase [Prolixibacteraceae bacterium]
MEQVFSKFSELNVLIIGDAMIDTYLWGKVDRISPEAPIPIVTVNKQENRLGGAGNVSLNIQAFGATPILVSIIGDDEKGKIFAKLMKEKNLVSEGLFIDKNRMTTVKTRIISGGQQISRVDQEISSLIDSEFEKKVFERIKAIIEEKHIHIAIFVDYDKGLITPWIIRNVIALAKSKNILTVADPKSRNFNNYQQVDLFKPNFKEFKDGLNLQIEKTDLNEIKKASEKFKTENQIGLLFITLSELGVFLTNGVSQNYYAAEVRDIADVSGAGDTVVATASLCLAAGLPIPLMAQISNLAGGLVCEKLGVVPIDLEQLKKEVKKIKLV